jgi:hypothetical protein
MIETSKRLPPNRAGLILFTYGTARNKNLHVFHFPFIIILHLSMSVIVAIAPEGEFWA